ncbi:hypothetical protein Tcan_09917 [Toxocara canis]|uniref:Uncharacterized protein n=1 Tax=Toxocara canis TaxID=6265 RepID=A0A0B2VEL9_TOXCA|nr:hypothetical protein Tcan_09917 [Toxocara canis]
MSGKGTQDSAEKKRCVRVLQNLMALPNVSLSVSYLKIPSGYLKILNSVGINESSIYRVVTDSGATMVCAFKNEYEVLHDETGSAGCEEITAVSISSDEDDSASSCSDGDLLDFGEDEIDDFEEADRKIGFDMRFPKRLSCMAHTLQLALAGGLKASGCRAEVDALIMVVGKFGKRRLAAERLHGRYIVL